MRKGLLILLTVIATIVGTNRVSAQYNREYFFWVGRQQKMGNEFTEAIRTLNVLLRFDKDAYEGYFLRGIASAILTTLSVQRLILQSPYIKIPYLPLHIHTEP